MQPGPNLKLGSVLFLFVFIVASLGFYAGAQLVDREDEASADAADGEEDGGIPGGPVMVRVVAKDLKFDKRSISASTGVSVTVTLDNQDAGVFHNISFYTNRNATQAIFTGELFPGPAARDFTFTAPGSPGSYFFRCDAHPDMNGSFTVR
jgi:plastocyanin